MILCIIMTDKIIPKNFVCLTNIISQNMIVGNMIEVVSFTFSLKKYI